MRRAVVDLMLYSRLKEEDWKLLWKGPSFFSRFPARRSNHGLICDNVSGIEQYFGMKVKI